MDYIDLSRRFRDLPQSELESPERLASLNETHWPGMAGGSVGWAELLEHPRVLVLAEAGSGKTAEMQGQAACLRAEGRFAFFVPLEALDKQNLAEILNCEEERDLDRWKSDGGSLAWFFLDAVDELKLIQGKLGKALNRFAKAIDRDLNRARCVISCRPSDFRPSNDLDTIRRTRTIESPDQILGTDMAEGVLNPAEILTDWTPKEHQALLRRGLFDPATYGRVRFHHRSVQEYLAACRLKNLRDSGMPSKSLNRLLFVELYGILLVKPSMQAVAAWLALWNDGVRRELMAREPETLLTLGDPESLSMAHDPSFKHFPDRLLLLARRRAATDAEGPALSSEDGVALEKRFEAPPRDRDGLFTFLIDRLDDMAHDIGHDDLSDRRTLQTVKDECEMQRTLARRLRDAANGSYLVAREEEVADLKKTDIRLLATRGDQKAVIEVKIADKRWTLLGLEGALLHQLVGQYLRHATCKAGCLLLTYHGRRKYWEPPETGQRLSFAEVVKRLEELALLIEEQEGYKVRLAVRALDLTDPPLKSSPKGKQASRKRRSPNLRIQ